MANLARTLFAAPERRFTLALIGVLLGAYLLVYVPSPVEADGKALLAVAQSLAGRGRADMNLMAAFDETLPPLARLGTLGADGALYSKKGPTPSLALVPLVWVADLVPWLSVRATALLFNALVSVLTALLLYAFARWLKYRPQTAFLLALIFGLATLMLVYVRTLFGEPLAGLLLLAALMCAYRFRQETRARDALWCGLLLALIVGINTVNITFVPVMALYLFAGRARWRDLIAFAAPILVVGGSLALYNWARFSSPLDSGYHFAAGEGFIHPVWAGLYGLFVSPYRGLLPYNPILLLAIPGWWLLRRDQARLAWIALALVGVQALSYASWWSWHGGILWGPRFMLPVIPLAVLMLAPLVERSWARRWLRVGISALAGLSLGVQLLGALFDYFPYFTYLYAHYSVPGYTSLASGLADAVVFDPALSPILGHLALALNGWPINPAWAANGDALHVLVALGLIGLGVAALVVRRRALDLALIPLCVIALNVVAARQQIAPGTRHADIQVLQDTLQGPGQVVVASALFGDALLDYEGSNPILTMNAPSKPDDPAVKATWDYALRQSERLWFVTWFGHADPLNWQEHELWRWVAFVREDALPVSVGAHRALLFRLGADVAAEPSVWSARFGPTLWLDGYRTRRAADGLFVTMKWRSPIQLPERYTWFVHLLDEQGQIVTQQDRAPQGGYAPTDHWLPDVPIWDRLFFPVVPGEGWQLRVGVIDPASGKPLPVINLFGDAVAEPFILLPVP